MELSALRYLTAPEAAPRLLGSTLVRNIDGVELKAKIVETEAYHQEDPASHTFSGVSLRNESMFKEGGHAYVYFTYGMHYCLNIVVGPKNRGEGVLVRAAEPLGDLAEFRRLRLAKSKAIADISDTQLTNGPAKLCQALHINKNLNGHDLKKKPLQLFIKEPINKEDLVTTTRIGIAQAKDKPYRFYIKDNPFVSRL